ncbi:MerR family transcriptional regulator [Gorillibacterium massiliense]|uniref:MerR family transcriptional regulator n=1 Tax=Gorillibacterium massiliense TaxID=1280390 RepID=UPI0004AC9C61|nr:MerR family transcriptional regulator [Gorillibacterium massiliense]
MEGLLRGQLAEKAKVNVETVRFYENKGLLPAPPRSESGYRLYSEDALVRLVFIQNAKLCGFTLKEIKKALNKSEGTGITVSDFITVIDRKVDSINREIAKKEKTKEMLAGLRGQLTAKDKHPDIQSVLKTLHMET